MMYSYPYFHAPIFPPMYRRYSPRYAFPQEKMSSTETPIATTKEKKTSTIDASIASSQEETAPQENRSCEDNPIFEIFGIKLFFDDLLILGLLIFLYSEGVQDQELFFALILLLFS